MATFFGLCDSSGNATGTLSTNTLTAETDFNFSSVAFLCPGSGTQVVSEITAMVHLNTAYNIRCAIYNSSQTVLIAQGTAGVAVAGSSDSWQGHTSATLVTPNPTNLTGGTNYVLVVSGDGDTQTLHGSTVVSGQSEFISSSFVSSGFSSNSLGSPNNSTLLIPVRVGVNPLSGAVSQIMFPAPLSGVGSGNIFLGDRLSMVMEYSL